MILRRFAFQHFQKNLVVASSQSRSSHSPELPRTVRHRDKALPVFFFSETRERRTALFKPRAHAQHQSYPCVLAYSNAPATPSFNGKYGLSFVSVPIGSESSWSASSSENGVPRQFFHSKIKLFGEHSANKLSGSGTARAAYFSFHIVN